MERKKYAVSHVYVKRTKGSVVKPGRIKDIKLKSFLGSAPDEVSMVNYSILELAKDDSLKGFNGLTYTALDLKIEDELTKFHEYLKKNKKGTVKDYLNYEKDS